MTDQIKRMLALWQSAASRNTSDVAAAIVEMTDDPIDVADRIAEAGQRDESLMPDPDTMDAINALATESK